MSTATQRHEQQRKADKRIAQRLEKVAEQLEFIKDKEFPHLELGHDESIQRMVEWVRNLADLYKSK